ISARSFFRLQTAFELRERAQAVALVLADPSLRDLVDRYRIEVVQLLAAAPDGGDEIGALQYGQMLAHRLPRHGRSRLGEARTKLVQGLAVVRVEPVEKLSAAGIRQGLEHIVHGDNMQPFGCLSTQIRRRGASHHVSSCARMKM